MSQHELIKELKRVHLEILSSETSLKATKNPQEVSRLISRIDYLKELRRNYLSRIESSSEESKYLI